MKRIIRQTIVLEPQDLRILKLVMAAMRRDNWANRVGRVSTSEAIRFCIRQAGAEYANRKERS